MQNIVAELPLRSLHLLVLAREASLRVLRFTAHFVLILAHPKRRCGFFNHHNDLGELSNRVNFALVKNLVLVRDDE